MEHKNKVLAILAIALILRIALFLLVPVTGDAIFHYNFTKFIAENLYFPSFEIEVGAGALPYFHPPLLHILGTPLYWIHPSLPFLAPIAYGIIGLAFLYKLSRLLFGEKTALYALAAGAVFPPLLYYSAINYTDSLMFAVICISFYFYFSHVKGNGRKNAFLLSLFFGGLALLTHYHGIAIPLAMAFHSLFVRRNAKESALLLLVPLLIASPWYLRNYSLYGNPVFPIFDFGYYPNAQYDLPSFSESVSRLAVPSTWINMFLEFLIGGPNSGDGYTYLSSLAEKHPFAYPAAAIWLLAGIFLSILAIAGIILLLRKHREFLPVFLFLLALSTFFAIQTPYPRMYFPLFPFLLSGAFFSIEWAKKKLGKFAIPAITCAIIVILIVPFAYAYIYKNMFEKHLEYYSLIKEKIPEGAVILSNSPERVIFYSGRLANYFGDVKGRIPSSILYSMDPSSLPSYGITHACSTPLLHQSGEESEFFSGIKGEVVFESQVGKCLKLAE